jgi:hypothetical protein
MNKIKDLKKIWENYYQNEAKHEEKKNVENPILWLLNYFLNYSYMGREALKINV